MQYLLKPWTDIYTKSSSTGSSLYELDGLRGIAVVLVILSHTNAFGFSGQGGLGVVLFFVLSGYVLTIPFAQNLGKILYPRELFRFFRNRILRIVPLYWISLVAITYMNGESIHWYWQNASFISGWNHLWSLAQEARFYVLFPIVIGAVALAGKVAGRTVGILFLVLLTYLAYWHRNEHLINMMINEDTYVVFYFFYFLGGMLACLIVSHPMSDRIFSVPLIKPFLVLFGSGTVSLFVLSSDNYMAIFWRPLIPMLPTKSLNAWTQPEFWIYLLVGLFIAATAYRDTILNRFLSAPILRHFGLLSFSMYLVHMNVMQVLHGFDFSKEGLFFVTLATSWGIAWITYIAIEKPFMRLKFFYPGSKN